MATGWNKEQLLQFLVRESKHPIKLDCEFTIQDVFVVLTGQIGMAIPISRLEWSEIPADTIWIFVQFLAWIHGWNRVKMYCKLDSMCKLYVSVFFLDMLAKITWLEAIRERKRYNIPNGKFRIFSTCVSYVSWVSPCLQGRVTALSSFVEQMVARLHLPG